MDVIIAPDECKKLLQVRLPRPKDGQVQLFFHDEDNLSLYEVIKHCDKYRSWFIDNLLCSEGHFNMMTKVDPLFVFVQLVMKFANDKFRTLEDMCEEYNVNFIQSATVINSDTAASEKFDRIDYALTPDINWSNICDTKEVDGELFMRFSLDRIIQWLLRKHAKLMAALREEFPISTSKATLMSYATDLIGDYIPEALCEDFKKAVRKTHLMGSVAK